MTIDRKKTNIKGVYAEFGIIQQITIWDSINKIDKIKEIWKLENKSLI